MKTIFFIIFIFISTLFFGEEISRSLQSINGEDVTTVIYKNHPLSLEKDVMFGKAPKYRLVVSYFNKGNPNFYDYCENYDVITDDPHFPEGVSSHSILYYVKNNPNEYKRMFITRNQDYTKLVEIEFNEINKNDEIADRSIQTYENPVRFLNREITYKNTEKNSHLAKYTLNYDVNQNVVSELYDYYDNSADNVKSKVYYYVPGKYDYKEKKYKKADIFFNSNSKGWLGNSTEFQNDYVLIFDSYDPTKNDLDYDKIVTLKKVSTNKTLRVLLTFAHLRQGKFAGQSIRYLDNGKTLITMLDANFHENLDESENVLINKYFMKDLPEVTEKLKK